MTKASTLAFLTETMFREKPCNHELYVRDFVDSSYIRSILIKRFEEVKATARQIERWVSSDGSWGNRTTKRIEGTPLEGRLLWIMSDENISIKTTSKPEMVEKLTVDCDNKYDIFSRHELLNQSEGNVKRSLI